MIYNFADVIRHTSANNQSKRMSTLKKTSMAVSVRLMSRTHKFYMNIALRKRFGQKFHVRNIHSNVKRTKATVAVPIDIINEWEKGANTKDPCYETVDLSFENSTEAYKSKTNYELLRSLLVFNLCSIRPLVDNNKAVSEFTGPLIKNSGGFQGPGRVVFLLVTHSSDLGA